MAATEAVSQSSSHHHLQAQVIINNNNNSGHHRPRQQLPPHHHSRLQQSASCSPARLTTGGDATGTPTTTPGTRTNRTTGTPSSQRHTTSSRKIRLTLLCVKNLPRGNLFSFNFKFSLPDVFCKIEAGSQSWTTETVTSTTSPMFRWTGDLHLSKADPILISVWNRKKADKEHKGFLGCVKIKPSDIIRLRDTGFQKLDLHRFKDQDTDHPVKGEVIVSILSRDTRGSQQVHPSDGNSLNPSLGGLSVSRGSSSTRVRPSSHSSRNQSSSTSPRRSSIAPINVPVALSNGSQVNSNPTAAHSSVQSNNTSNGCPPVIPPLPSLQSSSSITVQPASPSTNTQVSKPIKKKPPMPLPEETVNKTTNSSQVHPNKVSNSSVKGQAVVQNKKQLIAKMTMLRQELSCLQASSGHCRLEVSREDIFEESYRCLMKMKTKQLRKKLMVKFRGEEGIDYGGVAREWIYLLSKEMLNPDYGLFAYTRQDLYTLHINPRSHVNPDHLSYFHFVGRVLGLALFHGHHIGGHFSLPFYRLLLNKQITLDDIKGVDPDLHRGLQWMLDNPLDEAFEGTTFSVDDDHFGQMQVLELKTGGKDLPVTEENKHEYVRLFVNYRFKRGIEYQFQTLLKGFHEVVPPELLMDFDEKELELMIAGFGQIDLNDWKANTRLKHCTVDSNIVKWFWQVVSSYSEEQRARLLQFVTGSPRVPLQGFKALQGTTGATDPRLFTINLVEGSNTENLPQAHTCFNRIDIPPYESLEKLQEKLTQAIDETDAFGLD